MAPATGISKVFGVCGGLTTLAVCGVMVWNEYFSIDILTSMCALVLLKLSFVVISVKYDLN